ncbi:unnamed protein product [Lactuca saligna]|uniref:Uncharacterized protein n=1 Tax=Lactuca saligna TaxID=75948 RepID=A0AA35ZHE4_LACSI|nr:unnamed protein product [Lactuca saligna]
MYYIGTPPLSLSSQPESPTTLRRPQPPEHSLASHSITIVNLSCPHSNIENHRSPSPGIEFYLLISSLPSSPTHLPGIPLLLTAYPSTTTTAGKPQRRHYTLLLRKSSAPTTCHHCDPDTPPPLHDRTIVTHAFPPPLATDGQKPHPLADDDSQPLHSEQFFELKQVFGRIKPQFQHWSIHLFSMSSIGEVSSVCGFSNMFLSLQAEVGALLVVYTV